jgi:hypothetical protein
MLASRGTLRQSPMMSTMTNMLSASVPITHRTMVTTPKSSTEVRENSRALCQTMVRIDRHRVRRTPACRSTPAIRNRGTATASGPVFPASRS